MAMPSGRFFDLGFTIILSDQMRGVTMKSGKSGFADTGKKKQSETAPEFGTDHKASIKKRAKNEDFLILTQIP